MLAPTRADEIVLSGEVGRDRMNVDAYSETLSQANPFEAHVAEGTDTMTIAKIRAQWTHAFTREIDATVWVAGVQSFNRSSDLKAAVPGMGLLKAEDPDDKLWAEFGVRVGYRLT